MDLPIDFQTRMKKLLKEDYRNYLSSFGYGIGQTFRVNHMKIEPAELFRRLHAVDEKAWFEPVPWCEPGTCYHGEERLSLSPYYQAGLFYIQEPSAMAPASFLPVCPGERVLDLCAAPGGKTTALGARLSGKGLLVANDISISRCKALLKNIQMAGIPNVIVTCESPEKLSGYFPEYFDKILVDAPCSGEGMFRRDPAMIKNWSLEEVNRYSRLQKEILFYGAAMLKPGGCILYSTCTYSPEENEQIVETFLGQNEFSALPLPDYKGVDNGHPEWSLSNNPALCHCRRFWNHRVLGEGQFAALFRKEKHDGRLQRTAGTERNCDQTRKRTHTGREYDRRKNTVKAGYNVQQYQEEFISFLRRITWGSPLAASKEDIMERVIKIGERMFLLPEDAPDMSGLRVVSSGLHLGDCKKKRFEPGQALAMALRPGQFDNVLKLSPEDDRVERYLRCETIEADDFAKDGWCLVCIENFPLGWGKAHKGRIKNKYPAGWRRQ